jgi:hypothetical protein
MTLTLTLTLTRNTDSKLLFELVLRLQQFDMTGLLRLHITHVSGTRMIAQGTDGLSRGDMMDGVMRGVPFSSFTPLHLTAHDRSQNLLPCVQSWCPDSTILPLRPEEWFEKGHGIQGGSHMHGSWHPEEVATTGFLWSPAPGAVSSAIDELQTYHHKRPHHNHLFLCPRLFTQSWRQKLHQVANMVIELPAGSRPCWPLCMHNPL